MNNSETLLALLHPAFALLMGIILVGIWLFNKRHHFIRQFGIACIFYGVAVVQQVLLIPLNIGINIASTGFLYAASAVLFYGGLVTLGHRQPRWIIATAIALAYTSLRFYFAWIDDNRVLRVAGLYAMYSSLLLYGAWQISHMRHNSFLESSIFYVVIIFALSSLPRLLFTIFSMTEGYGYDGSAYWIIATYSFYFFFIIFSAALLMVVAMRTINEVKSLSFVDPLTKLLNRRGFENRANVKLNRVDKYSLLALDLDYFKRVNDQYGHQVGDQALKAVSKVIKDSLRVTDIASRFGGEEFIVLLPNTDFPIAQAIAERLRNEIEQCEIHTGIDDPPFVNVTASFGISTFDVSKSSLAQSLSYVDNLLYKAKNEGRNRVFGEVVQ